MKTTSKFLLVCFSATLFNVACKKAGNDGHTTVVLFAKHHDNVIKNHVNYPDTAYIKYNATELPASPMTDWDLRMIGEVGEDHIHVPDLHTGKYYIYMTGYDSSINSRVVGGAALKIKWSQRKSEVDVDIAVVE